MVPQHRHPSVRPQNWPFKKFFNGRPVYSKLNPTSRCQDCGLQRSSLAQFLMILVYFSIAFCFLWLIETKEEDKILNFLWWWGLPFIGLVISMNSTWKAPSSGDGSRESPESIERVVGMLLDHTRSKISEGSKDDALAALLHAIRISSGEDSIIRILDQAKRKVDEDYTLRDQSIAVTKATNAIRMMLEQDSFLSERGQEDILRDAFEDGSSIICQKCGGLVSQSRWEAHSKSWCPSLGGDITMDSDDD